MQAKMKFLLIIFLIHSFYARAEIPSEVLNSVPTSDLESVLDATKYCGPGNRAKNYNDLGWARETDICCRTHDNCPDWIEANKTKYGLTNTGAFTRLLCDCDKAFRKCLKHVKKPKDADIAAIVGYVYFTALDTQCFAYVHHIVGCQTYPGTDRCEKYFFDENSEKCWQWMDVPLY